MAWTPMAIGITTVAVILNLCCLIYGRLPVSRIPLLGWQRHPLSSVVVASVVYYLGVHVAGMDQVAT